MEQEGIVALVCFAVGALFGFVIGCERTQNLEAQKRRDQARSQA